MGLLLEASGKMDEAYVLLPFATLHPEHCLLVFLFVCVFLFLPDSLHFSLLY